MERHSEIGHCKGRGQVFEYIISFGVFLTHFIEKSSFQPPQPVNFLENLYVKDPVDEGNEVTWVYSVP